MEAAEQNNTPKSWQMARIACIGGSCNGLHEKDVTDWRRRCQGALWGMADAVGQRVVGQCNPLQFIGKTYTVFLAADSEDALHEPAQFLFSHGRRDPGDEPAFRRAAVTAAGCRSQIHTATHGCGTISSSRWHQSATHAADKRRHGQPGPLSSGTSRFQAYSHSKYPVPDGGWNLLFECLLYRTHLCSIARLVSHRKIQLHSRK